MEEKVDPPHETLRKASSLVLAMHAGMLACVAGRCSILDPCEQFWIPMTLSGSLWAFDFQVLLWGLVQTWTQRFEKGVSAILRIVVDQSTPAEWGRSRCEIDHDECAEGREGNVRSHCARKALQADSPISLSTIGTGVRAAQLHIYLLGSKARPV